MKKMLILTLTFGLALSILVACQVNGPGAAVPDEYAGLENPFQGNEEAADAGMAIYEERCIRCHGENGLGQGTVAENLNPPPSDLVFAANTQNEDYLFWRIAEGGQGDPISSSMPSFSPVLDANEIWQVITYLQLLD